MSKFPVNYNKKLKKFINSALTNSWNTVEKCSDLMKDEFFLEKFRKIT